MITLELFLPYGFELIFWKVWCTLLLGIEWDTPGCLCGILNEQKPHRPPLDFPDILLDKRTMEYLGVWTQRFNRIKPGLDGSDSNPFYVVNYSFFWPPTHPYSANVICKEIQILYRLFLVSCYLLHVPSLLSQLASSRRGWVIDFFGLNCLDST